MVSDDADATESGGGGDDEDGAGEHEMGDEVEGAGVDNANTSTDVVRGHSTLADSWGYTGARGIQV